MNEELDIDKFLEELKKLLETSTKFNISMVDKTDLIYKYGSPFPVGFRTRGKLIIIETGEQELPTDGINLVRDVHVIARPETSIVDEVIEKVDNYLKNRSR